MVWAALTWAYGATAVAGFIWNAAALIRLNNTADISSATNHDPKTPTHMSLYTQHHISTYHLFTHRIILDLVSSHSPAPAPHWVEPSVLRES